MAYSLDHQLERYEILNNVAQLFASALTHLNSRDVIPGSTPLHHAVEEIHATPQKICIRAFGTSIVADRLIRRNAYGEIGYCEFSFSWSDGTHKWPIGAIHLLMPDSLYEPCYFKVPAASSDAAIAKQIGNAKALKETVENFVIALLDSPAFLDTEDSHHR